MGSNSENRGLAPPVLAALSRIADEPGFSWVRRNSDGVAQNYEETKRRLVAEIERLHAELTDVEGSGNHVRAAELLFGDIPRAERNLREWQKLN